MRWFLALVGMLFSCVSLSASNPGDGAAQPVTPSAEAKEYAQRLLSIARNVSDQYLRPVPMQDLVLAALTGLYDAARQPMPKTLPEDVKKAAPFLAHGNPSYYVFNEESVLLLARARESLGFKEPLKGHEALAASIRGMTKALDPYSVLVSGEDLRRSRGADQQHGLGLDLAENAGGDALAISAVFPGGPAQKAGLRPGDEIVEVDGKSVKGMMREQLLTEFRKDLLQVDFRVDPNLPDSQPRTVQLSLRRPGKKESWKATLECQSFKPETVLGVTRKDDNSWDYWIDQQRKLAHVRLTWIGTDTRDELAAVLKDLQSAGMRGLLLDLRWCPGGYLSQAVETASLFLGDGRLVTVVKTRNGTTTNSHSMGEDKGKLLDVPIVVLVNGETSGGAELIAAALQDHKRAAVAGQRTLGKGNVQTSLDVGISGMGLKLTNGTLTRPSGKSLHRFPESRPADDWGVRPDGKLEHRVSSDLSRQLKEWWQQQTLRPGSSRERLPLDDPAADAQRQAALEALRGLVK